MLGSARSAFMAQPTPSVVLPAALAAYNFNENTGTTAGDATGNGHTMVLNDATWVTAGHTGSALGNIGQAPGASDQDFAPPTAAISLLGWVKPLSLPTNTTHFAFGFLTLGGGTRVAVFTQRSDFGNPNVLQADVLINGSLIPTHGPALTPNVWAHVAVTYDGTDLVLYKDGTPVASTSSPGTISAGDAFYVGGSNNSSLYETNEVIDDVRVFDVALTQAEIVAAMNTPV